MRSRRLPGIPLSQASFDQMSTDIEWSPTEVAETISVDDDTLSDSSDNIML